MLFKWFDFKWASFGNQASFKVKNIHNLQDLSDYNSRLGREMIHMRDSLAEIERKSDPFLSLMASHIAVPPRRLTRPIF